MDPPRRPTQSRCLYSSPPGSPSLSAGNGRRILKHILARRLLMKSIEISKSHAPLRKLLSPCQTTVCCKSNLPSFRLFIKLFKLYYVLFSFMSLLHTQGDGGAHE